MKTRFIINPISGNQDHFNTISLIKKYIDKKKIDFDIKITQSRNHAKQLSKECVERDYHLIIAVGGDGTVNEICSVIINTKVCLGVIPTGSGNGFAYHIGMKKDIKSSILQINKSKEKLIDTCLANNIPFVNVSGVGFDAHIAQLFSSFTKRGFYQYMKLVLQELSYKSNRYTIKYYNKEREINAVLIAFANASQYGNNFSISPFSNISDGLINFVVIHDIPKWKIPMLLFKIFQGKIHTSKYSETIITNTMEIHSNEKFMHLDGEVKKIDGNIKIKTQENSLKILIPNE